MRLRRESLVLKTKAIASLRRAVGAFNSYEEEGRVSNVLLLLQHAFEMLLKAGLVQAGISVFDPQLGQSIGFAKCVNLGREHLRLKDEEAGTLRAIDALRDDEQHWYNAISEPLLYAHVRAAVTLFDDLLLRVFEDRLVEHLPHRVMPVSSELPRDIQLLIDEEYQQVYDLLRPGRRRRVEANGRIRSLLAMEAHLADEVRVSRKDVARVEKAIREGKNREEVFPLLGSLQADVAGEGLQVTVRFSKREGAPVRYAGADEDVPAAAIREVDLQRKYHWSATELADRLGLTSPRATALRRHLNIDEDSACRYDFTFGRLTHRRYSDNAFTRMREALDHVDMEEIWRAHGARRQPRNAS